MGTLIFFVTTSNAQENATRESGACGIYIALHFMILYEYRDLFIDMAVRNNRSELAIANRHQER